MKCEFCKKNRLPIVGSSLEPPSVGSSLEPNSLEYGGRIHYVREECNVLYCKKTIRVIWC